ncbi:MAG: SDR family NAD(P)-dependent oxidoreductase, partial [Thiogranum sp.]|nr:SDR family NAD(P)-dependent oxidoreductase [Thiogranum sp.]
MTETILVTGSNRGIGLELAHQYAAQGWQVLACCRRPDQATALIRLGDKFP